jgi:alpha-amylase
MKNFKRFPLIIAILLIALAACGRVKDGGQEFADYARYESAVQGGAILHAFCWSFNAIAENMKYIAEAGFTAVQTSPISECITSHPFSPAGNNIGGPNGFWWFHYQPVSFRIGNYQLGTEEEFAEMCRAADEHGVKIIVDVVINHFAADLGAISQEVRDIEGGAFHAPRGISDWNDRRQVTQNQLLGLYDINTQNPHMQAEMLKYLKRCIELGASGFRYDAAYHIELPTDDPEFASDFWPFVLDNGAEFQYGEILGSEGANMYVDLMPVTDAIYGRSVERAARSGLFDAELLKHYRVNAPPERLVTWVESHDTYCNDGETSDLTAKQIIYGWAVIAARNASTPLFFSRFDGSTPGLDGRWGNNIIGMKGNDDYKAKEIAALNNFKRAMEGTDEFFSNPTGEKTLLMIGRGGSGAVIINTGGRVELNAPAPFLLDGMYEDTVSGGIFNVMDGILSGTVEAESVAAFYMEQAPSVSMSLNDGAVQQNMEFYTDEITLVLSTANSSNAQYTVGKGARVFFAGGNSIIIGTDMKYGDSVTVVLKADSRNPDGESVTREYTFTKRKITPIIGETVVYFNNTESWESVYCYLYTQTPTRLLQNGDGWPGEEMTHIGGNLFGYVLPDWQDFNVMFNNNDDGKQFPGHNAPGLPMRKGEHMLLEGTRLVPVPKP